MTITTDDDVLGGEPRIAGRRVGVRHVESLVIDGDRSPAYVADQYDLSLAEVYEALAYYYENTDEIRDVEREHATAYEAATDDSLSPKEPIS